MVLKSRLAKEGILFCISLRIIGYKAIEKDHLWNYYRFLNSIGRKKNKKSEPYLLTKSEGKRRMPFREESKDSQKRKDRKDLHYLLGR